LNIEVDEDNERVSINLIVSDHERMEDLIVDQQIISSQDQHKEQIQSSTLITSEGQDMKSQSENEELLESILDLDEDEGYNELDKFMN
ncbi:hypothetical protein KI387_031527, partial [Taxus chinensis]